ncbi:hypothetical protein GCM10028815_06230 [Mariniluteicoccus flavus]
MLASRAPAGTRRAIGDRLLEVEQWIGADPEAVYALLAEPRQMVRWNSGMRDSSVDEDGVVHGDEAGGLTGNRRMRGRWVCTVLSPLRAGRALVAWKLDAGGTTMVDAYEVEADGAGTRVRLTRERPGRGPLGWLVARLALVGMRHQLLGLSQAAA